MYVYLLVCLFIYSFEPRPHVTQVNLKLTESLRMTLKLCRGEALCSHILSPALQAGIHNAWFYVGSGDQTQSCMHARQALFKLSYISS